MTSNEAMAIAHKIKTVEKAQDIATIVLDTYMQGFIKGVSKMQEEVLDERQKS